MTEIGIGDKVRIKDQKNWPTPPGYVLAKAEGTVLKWVEYDETMEDFPNYILVHIDKAEGAGKAYVGCDMSFRADDMEKI